MQKSNNEQKNHDEIIFHNPKTKDHEKHKLVFHEPTKAQLNFIEKQIRKNAKYAKILINTKYAGTLVIETEGIPNSLYLTRINKIQTILDILLKKYGIFFESEELEKRIKENKEILEIILKNNINPIKEKSSDEFVLTQIHGKTLLEYILKNIEYNWDYDISNLKKRIEKNEEIYMIIFNHFIEKETIDNKQPIIEKIIEKGTPDKRLLLYHKHLNTLKENETLKKCILNNLDEKTIKYLIEKEEYEILKSITDTTLLSIKIYEKNTLFNILLEKNIIKITDNEYKIEDIIKNLIENEMYENVETIIKGKYDILLKKYDPTHTLLDLILKKTHSNISLYFKKSQKIIQLAREDIRYTKIFLNNNSWIDILNASDSVMDSKYNEDSTVYDFLIKKIKTYIEDGYINILSMHKIPKRILLQRINDKTLLEHILQKGNTKSVILAHICSSELYKDIEINTILKLNGIDIEKELGKNSKIKFNIEEPLRIQKHEIIKAKYTPYKEENINKEHQDLLNELRNVFKEDGRSNEQIIELACNSFIYSFKNNYKYAERDLKTLINIKINNPEFIMIIEENSHFDNMGILGINYTDMHNFDTFNHELAHAIHWYATENKIPELFENQQFEIDEEKYNEFINQFVSNRRRIIENIKNKKIDYYTENKMALEESNDYKKRLNIIFETAEKTYPKEIIDYLKEKTIAEEEYKNYYNKTALKELCILYEKDYVISIIDIVDALKKGKVYDEGIKTDDTIIKIGHGSKYFRKAKKDFKEMIAQYNEIIKSPYKDEAIEILKTIVGQELIKILEQFNEELVVYPLENKKQK